MHLFSYQSFEQTFAVREEPSRSKLALRGYRLRMIKTKETVKVRPY